MENNTENDIKVYNDGLIFI